MRLNLWDSSDHESFFISHPKFYVELLSVEHRYPRVVHICKFAVRRFLEGKTMKALTKRSRLRQPAIYCSHCFIRVGTGEHQVIRGGKIYHQQCDPKLDRVRAARDKQ